MIYVYALTDPVAPPAGALGFAGAPLQIAISEGAGAVHTTIDKPPPVTPDNLWQHESVVEALMGRAATLPARFGTVLSSAEEAQSMLAEHAEALRPALDRVRGLVEVGVRLRVIEAPAQPSPPAQSADPSRPGRAYLMQRLEREQRQEQQEASALATAREVLAPLTALAQGACPPAAGRASAVVSSAYLIRPYDVPAFAARVADIDAGRDELELVATGPWPAYSFAPALQEGARCG